MSPSIRFALSLLVGVAVGVGSASYLTGGRSSLFAEQLENWQFWPVSGAPNSNPYTIARYHNAGLLPEHFGEVLTFYRSRDDGGSKLSPDCTYMLEMPRPSARRWVVSVPTGDDESPQLLTQDTTFAEKGTIKISLSTTPQSGNWLKWSTTEVPKIVLRMYDGDTIVSQSTEQQEKLSLPSTRLVVCS